MIAVWHQRSVTSRFQLTLALFLPLLIAVGYRLLLSGPSDTDRLVYLSRNFETHLKTVDSIASTVIAFGFLWPLSVVGFVRTVRNKATPQRTLLLTGCLIAFPTTIFLAIAASYARETRIFFPPFVFVIPLSIVSVQAIATYARANWSRLRTVLYTALLITFMILGAIYIRRGWFDTFDYKANAELRGPLAGAYLGGFVAMALVYVTESIRVCRERGKKLKTLMSAQAPAN